jgi:hypothetical protein
MLLAVPAFGQLETTADFRRQVFDEEYSVGITLHTRGYGVNFRRLSYRDGFNKLGLELELLNLRHPREIRFPNAGVSGRGTVVNRLNSFYTLRVGYGRDKIFVDKTDRNSVSVSWITFGGLSLGLLKPVYIEVPVEDNFGFSNFTISERYDPEIHPAFGYTGSPFFTGIFKTQLRPGIYIKNGFSFDYDFLDEKVAAIEVGAVVDWFPTWFGAYETQVPILHDTRNYSVFFQFYVTINFGKKWN